jgi:tetratricopeptide (TPR) repeat protein
MIFSSQPGPPADESLRPSSGYVASRVAAAFAVAALAAILSAGGCRRSRASEYLSMGDLAMRDGRLADAEESYLEAGRLLPKDPQVHLALARLYAREQKKDLAQVEESSALDLEPRSAALHVAMADLYAGQSQLPMAEEHYRAATALDPGNSGYRVELASLLIKENKLSDAEGELCTALGLDPKNARGHFQLANLLNSEPGRQDEAQAEYAQAHSLDSTLVAPAQQGAPASDGAVTAAAESKPELKAKIKPVSRKFLLSRNSQVYAQPDGASRVVGNVHQKKFVQVTGITGDWLRIKLRTGTVGFIPVKVAE